MATLTIRDVPDDIARALSHQAVDAGKSREAYVRDILEAQASGPSTLAVARDILRRVIPHRTDASLCDCWVCDGATEWLAQFDRAWLEENASRRVWDELVRREIVAESDDVDQQTTEKE